MTREATAIRLTIEQVGPSEEQVEALALELEAYLAQVRLLDSSRLELLRIAPAYSPARDAPIVLHATYFDYGRNQALLVSGPLDGNRLPMETLSITHVDEQPLPSGQEFDRAVRILRDKTSTDSNPEAAIYTNALRAGRYRPYPTMPPLVERSHNRTLTVGLLPLDDTVPFVTMAVDMIQGTASTFRVTGAARQPRCGITSHDSRLKPTTGTAGAAWLTVTKGGTEVWKLFAARPESTAHAKALPKSKNEETPAGSGSGIELWSVRYKGKQVLVRAGVPIVTVKYKENVRGPFRDWAFQESAFVAVGKKIASGFRRCSQEPETAVTSGSDQGTFRGVAVFKDENDSLWLTSELKAGDYRYAHSWCFRLDGTIESTFGFTVTKGADVCKDHFHHAYWRLEFDLDGTGDNIVEEVTAGAAVPLRVETARPRVTGRTWNVLQSSTRHGYELIPGDASGHPDDMPARDMGDWGDDPPPPATPVEDMSDFGEGDVWVLNNSSAATINPVLGDPPSLQREIDDGIKFAQPRKKSNLNQFVDTTDPLQRARVVLWYGGHCEHSFDKDAEHEAEGGAHIHGHQVGLHLRPVN